MLIHMESAIPRDRNGSFEPQLIKKGQRHFDGFDEKIISMYARGMSTREIQGHLKEYKAQVQTCIVHMVRHSLRFVPWKGGQGPQGHL